MLVELEDIRNGEDLLFPDQLITQVQQECVISLDEGRVFMNQSPEVLVLFDILKQLGEVGIFLDLVFELKIHVVEGLEQSKVIILD
jgi:hypothetical protein